MSITVVALVADRVGQCNLIVIAVGQTTRPVFTDGHVHYAVKSKRRHIALVRVNGVQRIIEWNNNVLSVMDGELANKVMGL